MGIYIGIAVIAVALALIFAGAWGCEKENRRYWCDSYYDVCRQLRDERAHSDLLQEECKALAKKQIGKVFEGWTPTYIDERKHYIEKDGIHLIIEDDRVVGWYRP